VHNLNRLDFTIFIPGKNVRATLLSFEHGLGVELFSSQVELETLIELGGKMRGGLVVVELDRIPLSILEHIPIQVFVCWAIHEQDHTPCTSKQNHQHDEWFVSGNSDKTN
jgi:hypothetical protein